MQPFTRSSIFSAIPFLPRISAICPLFALLALLLGIWLASHPTRASAQILDTPPCNVLPDSVENLGGSDNVCYGRVVLKDTDGRPTEVIDILITWTGGYSTSMDTFKEGYQSTGFTSVPIGDEGYQYLGSERLYYWGIFFIRGCYAVKVQAPSNQMDLIRLTAAQIDAQVQAKGLACPKPETPGGSELTLTQEHGDLADPLNYQPYSFRVKLVEKKADGSTVPLENKTVVVDNPFNDIVFSTNFIAPECSNCIFFDYKGTKLAAPQAKNLNIELTTNADGEATFELFPNLAKLAQYQRTPSESAPLVTGHRVTYIDENMNVYEAKQTVIVMQWAIVEDISYTYPRLIDDNFHTPDVSETTISLAQFGSSAYDPCTYVGDQQVCGADRVKLVRGRTLPFDQPQRLTPGDPTLQVGQFIYAEDQIQINACDTDKPTNAPGTRVERRPAWVGVQLRFLDGVRARYTVTNEACTDFTLLATVFKEDKLNTILSYLNITNKNATAAYFFLGKKSQLSYSTKMPALEYVGEAQTTLGTVSWPSENETFYLVLRSDLFLQSSETGISITTVEGEPVIYNRQNQSGVPVAAGKTAVVAPDLNVTVQDTDPETAQLAQKMLAPIQGKPETSGEPGPSVIGRPGADPGSQPVTPALAPSRSLQIMVILLGCGLGVGLMAIVLGGGVVFFVQRSRPKKSVAPAFVPARAQPAHPAQSASAQRPPNAYPLRPIPASTRMGLVIFDGGAPRPFVLSSSPVAIGSGPSNQLIFKLPHVAPNQAIIFFEGTTWVVSDRGSSGGTWVNGARITRQVLYPNDRIQIGPVVLIFQAI